MASPPDFLYGYRRWRVDDQGRLYSLRGLSLLPFTAWPADRPLVATCIRGFFPWGEHRAPVESCTCGIYGWGDPSKLHVEDASTVPMDRFGENVRGVVQFWGRVAHGPRGIRAEKARVVALEHSDLAVPAADRYHAVLLGALEEW